MWKHKNFINLQLYAVPGTVSRDIYVNNISTTLVLAPPYNWGDNQIRNSDLYTISGNTVVWNDGNILQYNGVDVLPTDTIAENNQYTTRPAGGGKVTHILTIAGWETSSYYNVSKVNGVEKTNSDSPITLKNGDVIKVPTDRVTVTINGTSYVAQTTTLDLDNQDIALAASGPEKTLEVYNYVTINYTEPVDYIISETDLTTIADSIRTKTSSSDKLTPSAMAEKIRTIPVITDVSDAATLTAKLTEANIGNFYRYTGTATSDYTTGAIYQVTQA